MVLVNRNSLPPGGLRCRQIDETDIEAVASFLARGFPAHERRFWLDAFARLTKHEPPPGISEIRLSLGERSRRCRRDPPHLFDSARGWRCHDPLQSIELVCRTSLSPLRTDAGVAGSARQGRHLHQYFAGASHAADHRGSRVLALLRGHLFRRAVVEGIVRWRRRQNPGSACAARCRIRSARMGTIAPRRPRPLRCARWYRASPERVCAATGPLPARRRNRSK
jgi:hypothetical protein